ncbi:hypothetical protein [Microbacterium foliorum]|uniref:hypothetical protein n=1 Tax=Microbacterium foliorum TaxID=104336 RepID=UPI0028D2CCED|nr:hypothetical protein [Microbacterium foliorum]
MAALFAWLSAVEIAAVTAHREGRDADAQHWVAVAAQFVETKTYATYNDPNVPVSWFDDVIVPARSGDFSAMAEEARLEGHTEG